MMLWRCNSCSKVVASDPLAHDDTGDEVKVYGPHCTDCDEDMDYLGEGAVLPDGSVRVDS